MANIEIKVEMTQLNEAIEKVNRLNELLEQAQNKIDSLSSRRPLKATVEEIFYLEKRKEAFDQIHSRETSPPSSK